MSDHFQRYSTKYMLESKFSDDNIFFYPPMKHTALRLIPITTFHVNNIFVGKISFKQLNRALCTIWKHTYFSSWLCLISIFNFQFRIFKFRVFKIWIFNFQIVKFQIPNFQIPNFQIPTSLIPNFQNPNFKFQIFKCWIS